MSRVPLRQHDLAVGQKVKWDVYDSNGKLLLAQGTVIENEKELHELVRQRAFRDLDFGLKPEEIESLAKRKSDSPEERAVRMPLEETRIKPGDMIQLQDESGHGRMEVRLIGYQRGKSVITTEPQHNGSQVFLREGSSFIARAFSGQLAFAFPCSVLANPIKPYPHVHLSYPGNVSGLKVRRSERVRLRVIVALNIDNGKVASGIFTNLSVGGALLLSRSPDISVGCGIVAKFKLLLNGFEYLLELQGAVRSIAQNQDEPEFNAGYGIQFTEVSAEDALIISSFVFQLLAENKLS